MRQLAARTGEGGQRAGKVIHDYSSQFQHEFVTLLSRRFGTRRVLANTVYQEYIQDRHHIHMNATRWVSLSEFVKFLGRAGIAKVEGSELGWFISWIDTSSTARARQDAIKKMDREKIDDEQRSRKELDEQIRRAQEQYAQSHEPASASLLPGTTSGILRQDSQLPVKLSLSLSKESASGAKDRPLPSKVESHTSRSISESPPTILPKRTNPLKAASKASERKATTHATSVNDTGDVPLRKRPPPTHLGAAERIILEEQASKRSSGPTMQPGVKRSRF